MIKNNFTNKTFLFLISIFIIISFFENATSFKNLKDQASNQLLFTEYNENDFIIYENGMLIDFEEPSIYSAGDGACKLVSTDVNNDQASDIVVSNFFDNTISVLINRGDGTFIKFESDFSTGDNPGSLATGDFNRDDLLDIAVVNSGHGDPYPPSNTISLFLNLGIKNDSWLGFSERIDLETKLGIEDTNPNAIICEDLDGDNLKDLAVSNYRTKDISIFLNVGVTPLGVWNGFASPISYNFSDIRPYNPTSLGVADLNCDGSPDLVVTDSFPFPLNPSELCTSLLIFINKGNGTFIPFIPPDCSSDDYYHTVGACPFQIRTNDIDRDGLLDIAVLCLQTDSIHVLLNRGFTDDDQWLGLESPIIPHPEYQGCFLFDPARTFFIGDNYPSDFYLADLNGNCYLDIVAVLGGNHPYYENTEMVILYNNKSENDSWQGFLNPNSIPFYVGPHLWQVISDDLDYDGVSDIIVTNAGDHVSGGGWPNASVIVFLNSSKLLPRVEITQLDVFLWPPGGLFDYSIHWEVHNFEEENVTVEFEYTLILPNGSSTNASDIWNLPANSSFACFMDCRYKTDLYGNYTYGLTIKDLVGIVLDSKSVSWVREPPLIANANGPYQGFVNESVQFIGSADGGVTPYTYLWDFGDGCSSTNQSPTHIYDSPGNYTVSLTVMDDFYSVSINLTWALIQEKTKLEITDVTGGFDVSCTIKNIGDVEAANVNWNINVQGGIFGLVDVESEDQIVSLDIGDIETIQTDKLIFGFGKIDIDIIVTHAEIWSGSGFVLGPFIFILKIWIILQNQV